MAEVVNAFSSSGPAARKLYQELLTALQPLGPFREEIKKTSVHLARKSAFAGVHPRKEHLIVTIKAEKSLKSARIVKAEQVSKSRWHLDVKLSESSQIDAELMRWMSAAYELCA